MAVGNSSNEHDVAVVGASMRRLIDSPNPWKILVNRPALLVSYLNDTATDTDPILLRSDRGFIFGRLFETADLSEPQSTWCRGKLSDEKTDELIRSQGRSLISHFWGHYVAAFHYPRESEIVVLRAPASPMPCLRTRHGSLHGFFSDIADYRYAVQAPLSINWNSITAQVVGGDYLAAETAFTEIQEMSGGEAVVIRRGETRRELYWEPKPFLARRSTATFQAAVQAVRSGVDHCIGSLSAPYDNILVTASGGLDSSIVLNSLTRAGNRPHLEAVNFHSPGVGDERRFARAVCEFNQCRLREIARDTQLNLGILRHCNLTARPVLNFSAPDVERRTADLARELGSTAIFNGELGDNLFGSHPGPGAMVDAMLHFGLGLRFASSALDYALLNRVSFWRAVFESAREFVNSKRTPDFDAMQAYRNKAGSRMRQSRLLASTSAVEQLHALKDRFLHPWLEGTRRLAPGAHMMLFGLINVTSTAYHPPFSRPNDPAEVFPLVGQPLVEIALSIPAHLHCIAGTDRAVARAAFQDALPTVVLHRGLGKGGPTTWAQHVVRTNAVFLRELLLDGMLVERGLLDRPRLEAALSPGRLESTVIVGDIFAKAYIEAWLRNAQSESDSPAIPAQAAASTLSV